MLRFLAFTLVLAASSTASAANRCERLHEDYKAATAKIAAALRSYADCIDDGNPRDSCVSDYARLRSSQRLLEVATSEFARYCRSWPDRR